VGVKEAIEVLVGARAEFLNDGFALIHILSSSIPRQHLLEIELM
jgi:hypothetical protein